MPSWIKRSCQRTFSRTRFLRWSEPALLCQGTASLTYLGDLMNHTLLKRGLAVFFAVIMLLATVSPAQAQFGGIGGFGGNFGGGFGGNVGGGFGGNFGGGGFGGNFSGGVGGFGGNIGG